MDLDASVAVFDLDGTLATLAVDWATADRDASAALAEHADATADATGRAWDALDRADAVGSAAAEAVHAVIAEHERAGAHGAGRGPAADALDAFDGPAGVCSLNCEAACWIALDRHDLAPAVTADAVVGRDTTGVRKPDPAPLLAAIDRLGADPDDAVFVGDSDTDAEAAVRAGVAFKRV
jgi:phosphoglycolate phosphatase